MTAPDLAPLAARLGALPPSPVRDALLAAVTVPCPCNGELDRGQHAQILWVPCVDGRLLRDTSGWPPGAVAGALLPAFMERFNFVNFTRRSDGRWMIECFTRDWEREPDEYFSAEAPDPDAAALAAAAAWAESQGAGKENAGYV